MAASHSSIGARLATAIDPSLEQPLARQIAEHLWTEIIEGTLAAGERLPTVRRLAVELGLHPRVIERSFAELEARGVVRGEVGGVFVCLRDDDAARVARNHALEQLCAETLARAEQLDLELDELIDALCDLRLERRARRPE
jgi:GntR family transcriptional regulator